MNPQSAIITQPRSRLRRAVSHPLLAPFNQSPAWERLSGLVNPAWSWSTPRAKVVRTVDEAPGVRSLWLRPNSRFGSFQPGQHVLLTLEIDGALHSRCFSLSDAPRRDGLIRLTIRKQDSGNVSTAAHALQLGQVVRISKAQGQFAPNDSEQPLLLISAGSGVTPMMSMLRAMANAGSTREVVLLHSGRSEGDMVFGAELAQLASEWPKLHLHLHFSNTSGRIDAAAIAAQIPDWAEREALVCGPAGLMALVAELFDAHGLSDQLLSESFGRIPTVVDPTASEHAASAENSKHMFTVLAGQSLLDAAEGGGLTPRFGCRRGICRTCQCKKISGSVRNLLTGDVSGDGEELIQLCISTPLSPVALAL